MSRCPSKEALLEYWATTRSSDPSPDPVGAHVAVCVRCQGELAELGNTVGFIAVAGAAAARPASPCLDDVVIAALAHHDLDRTTQSRAVDHLVLCGDCRSRFSTVWGMLADEAVAAEIHRIERLPRPAGHAGRWLRLGVGLAGAAAIVLLIRTAGAPSGRVRDREEPVTLISAPSPLQPAGSVTRVDSMSWRAVPRAHQYRVILFARNGSTVWEGQTGDTVVAVPPSISLVPGATYFWKVEARTDWNRWTASGLVEIRIATAR
jgi:hypothetical protein